MNIDIESLDWELLERVAVTEGRRLSKESWNIDDISPAASSALAEIYVERYLDAPEAIVLPLAEAAAEEFEERYSRDASYPDWPAEFIVGHALAVNARPRMRRYRPLLRSIPGEGALRGGPPAARQDGQGHRRQARRRRPRQEGDERAEHMREGRHGEGGGFRAR